MKYAISSLALAAAMAFTGGAFAQATTIGPITIDDTNRSALQEHCDVLKTQGAAETEEDDDDAEEPAAGADAGGGAAGGDAGAAAGGGAAGGDAGAAAGGGANADAGDDDDSFAEITLEMCQEAGLVD